MFDNDNKHSTYHIVIGDITCIDRLTAHSICPQILPVFFLAEHGSFHELITGQEHNTARMPGAG